MAINTKVVLVGAGPGDPELISIKGLKYLKKADLVLYDYLAHPNLLNYTKPDANVICVGKKKGFHSKTQAEIHRLITSYIGKVELVVRLKGGDPMIFGRGGEEIEFLFSKKVDFEVVPGISSAIAVPTFAGIPLTHRNLSKSVAFMTGTLQEGGPLATEEIPRADTLVVLMGIHHLKQLADRLMVQPQFGPETPVAIIEKGTTAKERLVTGTLSTIYDIKEHESIQPPALLVVGKVVTLSRSLKSTRKLPLKGKRIWLFRSFSQSQELLDRLSELGAELFSVPLLAFKPNEKEMVRCNKQTLEKTDMVIVTSPNGVAFFMKGLYQNGLDSRDLKGKLIVAIGPKTAEALAGHGLRADLVPESYSSDGLAQLLEDKNLHNKKIVIPTAAAVHPDLQKDLESKGAFVTKLSLYATKMPGAVRGTILDDDILVFTSSSTVSHFAKSGLYSSQHIQAVSIGPKTSHTLETLLPNIDFHESSESSTDGLVNTILSI